MRVLIDECLPRQLKVWLLEHHDPSTLKDKGWEGIKNGNLLRLANDAGFDVLVTADKNMHYQQNFVGLTISAVVVPSNFKPHVRDSVPALLQTLKNVKPGQKVVIDLGPDAEIWDSLLLDSIHVGDHHVQHVFKPPGVR